MQKLQGQIQKKVKLQGQLKQLIYLTNAMAEPIKYSIVEILFFVFVPSSISFFQL